ncbi:MAG: basic secretory family protein [Planctomycetaceae bacterium]|jgi:hypothetical protein|nr:basic secretory family protein [Planctomycetaceae bacterium]
MRTVYFLPVFFILSSAAFCFGELPDGVKIVIIQEGKQPAKIAVELPNKPAVNFAEGEWDKVPAEAKAYLAEMFRFGRTDVEVKLDCSESPDSKEWGENAVKVVKEQFPKLVKILDSEGFQPAKSITLHFKKMDGVAYTAGTEITISEDWIKKHPEDIGMVVHETIHVVQAYRGRMPSWVTEGIADYIRFYIYEETGDRVCPVNPDRAKYTDSYRTTAAFFNWIVLDGRKDFITKLNERCRNRQYSDTVFFDLTGKSVDELWNEFIETRRKK